MKFSYNSGNLWSGKHKNQQKSLYNSFLFKQQIPLWAEQSLPVGKGFFLCVSNSFTILRTQIPTEVTTGQNGSENL